MANLKPNKKYKIISINIAVPADEDEYNEDKISEMLDQAIFDGEVGIDDWEFGNDYNKALIVQASEKPEDGELFKNMS